MNSQECLLKTFGYSSFRDQQQNIIETLVDRKQDICAIMPTGHGKSICYQLPPVMTGKLSIVVSPLLSLMEDQQTNLAAKTGIKSCCYNSNLADKSATRLEMYNGEYSIIYFTPEMIVLSEDLLKGLNKKLGICVIAIDEAHCVSSWGNSFRASYLELSCLKRWFPDVPLLALTGTATPKVQDDIITLLGLPDSTLKIRTSSDRPNLSYYIHPKTTIETDLKIINAAESTIIYCPKRKVTEKLADALAGMGIQCKAYHAGLAADVRTQIHHQFLEDKLTCIIATVAFGMGIDKPDIRKVIHYGCPKDIESYVQEIGRAGRDGKPSECHVFFAQADFATNRFFLQDIHNKALRDYRETTIHAIEKYLYIQTCRRAYILEYFGEQAPANANANANTKCCDNCLSIATTVSFNVGQCVKLYLELIERFADGYGYGKQTYINVIRGAKISKMPVKLKSCKFYGADKGHSVEWWKFVAQHLLNAEIIGEKSVGSGSYGTIVSVNKSGAIWLKTNITDPTYIITLPTDHHMIPEFSTKPTITAAKVSKFTRTSSAAANVINIDINANSTNTTSSDDGSSSGPITNSQPQPITNITIIPAKNASGSAVSSPMQSYNLFQIDGKSIAEIAQIRSYVASTIEGHIVDMVTKGLPIDYNRIGLTGAKYDEINGHIDGDVLKGDVSKLSPIKALCSADTTYMQIKLALLIRKNNSRNLLT